MYLPRELWYNILEYSSTRGQLKYTCHEFLNLSLEICIKNNRRGDDIFTDTIIVNHRFKNYNRKTYKYILRTTKDDFRYIAMCKQEWLDKNTILGTTLSNKYITNTTRKYVLMNIVGKGYGNKNTIKSMIYSWYDSKNYDMIYYVLFWYYPGHITYLLELISRYSFKLIGVVEDGYLTPKQYYIKLTGQTYYIHDLRDLLNKYYEEIIRDCNDDMIRRIKYLRDKHCIL